MFDSPAEHRAVLLNPISMMLIVISAMNARMHVIPHSVRPPAAPSQLPVWLEVQIAINIHKHRMLVLSIARRKA
jgi:hypothetical protein